MNSYSDGSKFLVGDHVLIERGRTPATIEYVIASDEDILHFDMSESGLMLLSAPFGRVFLPFDTMEYDPPIFVSRGSQA